jgi:hypothetical protein
MNAAHLLVFLLFFLHLVVLNNFFLVDYSPLVTLCYIISFLNYSAEHILEISFAFHL